MNYPLITEYIESIKAAEDNFDQLKNLRPVLDNNGQPIMTGGNFAVVFKMKDVDTGKIHAVKCFLKEQEGRAEAYRQITEELENVSSAYLIPIKYLDKELFVNSCSSDENEFPVLLMDWVEGRTLDKYIREHIDDKYVLSLLAYQFSCMAIWLLSQPFAHGDLKPDNIIVMNDGTLVLVDYDGMFVPAMRGQKARELGSPDFRHPSRTKDTFDENIDDFSLISIMLSLKAISLQPELLETYGTSNRLLFSEKDYCNLSDSKIMDALKVMMYDSELATLFSLFILSISQNNLSQVSFKLLNLSKPNNPLSVNLDLNITYDDFGNTRYDEYGVEYSEDWTRLIKAPIDLSDYCINKRTKVICDDAFSECEDLNKLVIPDGVTHIGQYAFYNCKELNSILLPNSVTVILSSAFENCSKLKTVSIPENLEEIADNLFAGCYALESIVLPNKIKQIGIEAFYRCKNLKVIIFPPNLTHIGKSAFRGCISLSSIEIPDEVTFIGECAFADCHGMKEIDLPKKIDKIEACTFQNCSSLQSIEWSNRITSIGEHAFEYCISLSYTLLPDTIELVEDYSFAHCGLISITMPNNLVRIGSHAFAGSRLSYITFNSNLLEICDSAFEWCTNLESIIIPRNVKTIGHNAFYLGWSCLGRIIINSSKIKIDQTAFDDFEHTHCVTLISIPPGSKETFEKMLPDYKCVLMERKDSEELNNNV